MIGYDTIVLGLISGALYSLAACALVLVFRVSRVVNVGQAGIGVLAATSYGLLADDAGVPRLLAAAVAVAAAVLAGWAFAGLAMARLEDRPPAVHLLATVGLGLLLAGVAGGLPSPDGFPALISASWTVNDRLVLDGPHLAVAVVTASLGAVLAAYLFWSRRGLALRAIGDDHQLARLAGVTVRQGTTWAWAGGAGVVALAAVLYVPLAPERDVGIGLLVRALAGASLGGLRSFPAAIAGGLVVGIGEAMLLARNPPDVGRVDVVLFVVVSLALLAHRGSLRRRRPSTVWPVAVGRLPSRLRGTVEVRAARVILLVVVFGAAALLLASVGPANEAKLAFVFATATVALSITVATGLTGPVWLAQWAIAGLSALAFGALAARDAPEAIAAVVAVGFATAVAVAVGTVPARAPAVVGGGVTVALALAIAAVLDNPRWLRGDAVAPASNGAALALVVLGGAAVLAWWARWGRLGRLAIAAHDHARGAAAFGVSPRAATVMAVGAGGVIAATAGIVLAKGLSALSAAQYQPVQSLTIMAVAVVGGANSVTGTVAGAVVVAGIPLLLAPDSTWFATALAGGSLVAVLVARPGGLTEVAISMRDRFGGWVAHRHPEPSPAPGPAVIPEAWTPRPLTLLVEDVTVAHHGVVELYRVSLEVPAGGVVGVVGLNGAGKSALLDVVSGFEIPRSGRVRLGPDDITHLSPVRRSRMGLARTFQDSRLFPSLTLLDTVAVAMERHATRSGRRPRATHARVEQLVEVLGLGALAGQPVTELSIGSRRLVEIACVLAHEPSVLLLDEPSAGVTRQELEVLGPLLRRIHQATETTLVIAEHDLTLVQSISDEIYVMSQGRMIARGTAAEVRSNRVVFDEYFREVADGPRVRRARA